MLKKIIWLVALLPLNVIAVEVSGLYQAEIEVADQGQEERSRAIVDGFKQVVVKITGSRSAAANSTVRSAAAGSGRYVQQYRYQLKSIESGADSPEEKTFIQMSFDRIAVNQLLRNAGLPVWGSQRPQTLAWVGVESNGQRRLLRPESDQQLISQLQQQAFNRGISIMLPLMDLEDQSALTVSDLWGSFDTPVQPDENRRWEHQGSRLIDVTREGINDIADALALRFAPAGGNQSEMVTMQVENINSFAELARVQKMLTNSAAVDDFELRSARQDKVIFAMTLRGGLDAFAQAMTITGVLAKAQPSIFDRPDAATSSSLSSSTLSSGANTGNPAGVTGQNLSNDMSVMEQDIQLFYRLL
ncbi:MAG: DUF2066 domain-containing protein [Gammaproteobacteria bacterium]